MGGTFGEGEQRQRERSYALMKGLEDAGHIEFRLLPQDRPVNTGRGAYWVEMDEEMRRGALAEGIANEGGSLEEPVTAGGRWVRIPPLDGRWERFLEEWFNKDPERSAK